MAACDSKYKFTLIDIGANGINSDGSIFASSAIGQAVKDEELNVPQGQIQFHAVINQCHIFSSVIKLFH